MDRTFYIHTPLVESAPLSKLAGCKVYMKLDNNQPCGSFKLRGLSNLVKKRVNEGCTKLVASSGGNAGMAAAYVSKRLGVPLTLYVPESTGELMRKRLADEGANVCVHGRVWDEADKQARKDAESPGVAYVPPFDHPYIWEGHESMVRELAKDLSEPPDLVIVSVGGGGLLIGIAHGMKKVGWDKVPILAMETEGANCFNAAINAGELVTLTAITSIANTLGALTVCGEALRLSKERPILSSLISDKQCVEAIAAFLDDHRILVEPACGAAIAAIYSQTIQKLQIEGKLPSKMNSIVLIVCGGVGVTNGMLEQWKEKFDIK